MAECDGTAVYVHFFAVQAEFFFYREILGGEGFVHFDQADVVEGEPGFLQGELGGGYGAASHYFRIYSGGAPAYDSAEGLQVALLRVLYRHDDHGGGAIDDATGVTRGDRTVFSEGGLELGQTFHGGLGAAMVVFGEHLTSGFALGIFEGDGDEFLLQASGLVSVIGTLLGAESVFILHLASDALLLTIKLGGIGHVEAAVAVEQGDHQRIFE